MCLYSLVRMNSTLHKDVPCHVTLTGLSVVQKNYIAFVDTYISSNGVL